MLKVQVTHNIGSWKTNEFTEKKFYMSHHTLQPFLYQYIDLLFQYSL